MHNRADAAVATRTARNTNSPRGKSDQSTSFGSARISSDSRKAFVEVLAEIDSPRDPIFKHLLDRLSLPEFRATAVRELERKPYLLSKPELRARLLEALSPYPQESEVVAYALTCLWARNSASSAKVVGGASKILLEGEHLGSAAVRKELLDLAREQEPGRKQMGAAVALLLLKGTELSTPERRTIGQEAWSWYLGKKGDRNPWLDALAANPSKETIVACRKILGGEPVDSKKMEKLHVGAFHILHTTATAIAMGATALHALAPDFVNVNIQQFLGGTLIASVLVSAAVTTRDYLRYKGEAKRGRESEHLQALDTLGVTFAEGERRGDETLSVSAWKMTSQISIDPQRPENVRARAAEILRDPHAASGI